MSLKNTLKDIQNLYIKNNGYINESRYKQIIFLDFFTQLGYVNKFTEGIEEIKFEVSDEHNKRIDIIVGEDILVEVKSSNVQINNKDFIDQAFCYNSKVGLKLVILTNFKEMSIYSIGQNRLIYNCSLINFNEDTIKNLTRILHPYVFDNDIIFDNFFDKFYIRYKQYLEEMIDLLKNRINSLYFEKRDIKIFKGFFENVTKMFLFFTSHLKNTYLRKKLVNYYDKLSEYENNFPYYIQENEHGYYINKSFLKEFSQLFDKLLKNNQEIINLNEKNVFSYNLDEWDYVDEWYKYEEI